MPGKIPTFVFNDQALQQFQEYVVNAVNSILGNPLLDGRLIKDVLLASGDNQIEHRLARNYAGYIVTKKNANVDIYQVAGEDNIYLVLNSSGTATVDIWVF